MHKLAPVLAVVAGLALGAPAVASASPSLRADPNQGKPGDDVTLNGRGWIVGGGCSNRITLFFKQGERSLKLGSALHGDGRFTFDTHYQQADSGTARFVARQRCENRTYRRAAYVTIGGGSSESVTYRGETEHGGRLSFVVVDGNEVRSFRFVNRCSTDRRRGSRVPGGMPIGDISFSREAANSRSSAGSGPGGA